MGPSPGSATAAALLGLAGLHVAWGRGATFPFRDVDSLEDALLGGAEVPAPLTCYAVAGLLVGAAVVVADVPVLPARTRQVGRVVVAGVLGLRGLLGQAGRSDLYAPHATDRFRRLDQALYSPLCLALATGALSAAVSRLVRPLTTSAGVLADVTGAVSEEGAEPGVDPGARPHLLPGRWRPAAKVAGTLLVALANR